jgi:hypothetical protein
MGANLISSFGDSSHACENCIEPGHCCRDFPLMSDIVNSGKTRLEVMVVLASYSYHSPNRARVFIGFPFIPSYPDEKLGYWRFNCINLLPSGRCGDYENRPYGPCVMFQPLTDYLCIMTCPERPKG